MFVSKTRYLVKQGFKLIGILTLSLFVIALAYGIFLFIFNKDEALNPQLQTWLDEMEHRPASDADYYLLGFFAGEGQDPLQVGKKRYEQMLEQKNTIEESKDFVWEGSETDLKDELVSKGGYICGLNSVLFRKFIN